MKTARIETVSLSLLAYKTHVRARFTEALIVPILKGSTPAPPRRRRHLDVFYETLVPKQSLRFRLRLTTGGLPLLSQRGACAVKARAEHKPSLIIKA